eukprot:TRINITY_DN2563_c0_g1_i10.p1 TRINITY_DN2563_c0_g1~~TRINITY_DN2563_c0_g1_i10.p1  ORF type:complete len:590 (-),score=50.20 TRINITY_DN2563_c0_g1_i10:788-2557(-)
MTRTFYILLFLCIASGQNVKDFSLSFTHEYRYPDGFRRRVVTTNGQFFGPELRVNRGDFVRLKLINNFFTDTFTIHFHGLRMQGSAWYDGVDLGTQCPILKEFVQEFTVTEEPGTHFYHGHQGALRFDGLLGPLIIEDTPELKQQLGYDEEYTMMMLDWYHATSEEKLLDMSSPLEGTVRNPPFWRYVGNPDTFLVNGKGYWNTTGQEGVNDDNFLQSLASFETFTVQTGKKYMFRIISGTTFSFTNVWIQGHTMKVVRADGKLVQPFEVESLDVNSGQRYDVIVEANQPSGYYWIQMETRYRSLVKGWALLKYDDVSVFKAPNVYDPVGLETLPSNPLPIFGKPWDPRLLKGAETLQGDMAKLMPSRTLVVRTPGVTAPNEFGNIVPLLGLALNQPTDQAIPYYKTKAPLMTMLKKGRCDLVGDNTIMWPNVCKGEESLKPGEVIDIVLENYPVGEVIVLQHPWHLHGYSFYVLGHGIGSFSYEEDGDSLNLVNPVQRDTATQIPSLNGTLILDGRLNMETQIQGQPNSPSGWVVIRFLADNPGVWNFHCHLSWHSSMGMQMFIVDDIDSVPEPPSSVPQCGPVELFQ